jgi:alpha-1,6-mannosyltransferase
MRIVHIANFYGSNSGGIRTTLHKLGKGYIEHGHQFIFIVPGNGFFREETPMGERITVPSLMIPFSGGYRVIRNNTKLRKLLEEILPDRIEVSDRFTLSSIGLWAKSRNIPAVVFSHETLSGLAARYFPFSLTRFVNWHNRRLASRFDYVVTTTRFAAREFEIIQTTNLAHIPLGVDLETFTPHAYDFQVRHSLSKDADYLLVHVGRMSPEKCPLRSISTVAELTNRGYNVRLVYIGIGPMWKKMRSASADLPITFLGYIANRHKVAAILASADVSLAPGPIETFCLAALESIASGTPVVASSTSAVGEILTSAQICATGSLAENNSTSFADAVERVLISKNSETSSSCREQAERFSWERTIEGMLELHGIESGYKTDHLSPEAA